MYVLVLKFQIKLRDSVTNICQPSTKPGPSLNERLLRCSGITVLTINPLQVTLFNCETPCLVALWQPFNSIIYFSNLSTIKHESRNMLAYKLEWATRLLTLQYSMESLTTLKHYIRPISQGTLPSTSGRIPWLQSWTKPYRASFSTSRLDCCFTRFLDSNLF